MAVSLNTSLLLAVAVAVAILERAVAPGDIVLVFLAKVLGVGLLRNRPSSLPRKATQ
jgi:hypothetical protein